MAHILLLRAPSQDSSDRYEATFKESGYNVSSVPVLETVLTNLDDLKRTIQDGPAIQNYGGVIMTSGRACEAWKSAVKDLVDSFPGENDTADWSSTPFYVVGRATASALADIGHAYGHSCLAPRDIRGESSGISEQLAHFILEDLGGQPTKLLYLTGDKNRDTLPTILKTGSLELVHLKVYETRGSSSFATDLEDAVNSASAVEWWWIVFFAPSAAEFVTPTLRKFFSLPGLESTSNESAPLIVPRIAAIGPTTSAFLRDRLKLRMDVISPKPTPDNLVAAIVAHDKHTPL